MMAASPISTLSSCSSSALSPIHSFDIGSSHKRRALEALDGSRNHDYPHKLERDDDDATEDAALSPVSRLSSPALTAVSGISSDTSGSAPGTPKEEDEHGEQVTVCQWEGCGIDLGNMDELVKHIHDEHIGTRRAKYACEWVGCIRKNMPHASGYALRAHMRSHTREKPFYCTLPECDRSFTRSDALAKHMRTVHETEALRPSDPIPRSHPNHPTQLSSHAYESIIHPRRSSLTPSPTPFDDNYNNDSSNRTDRQNTGEALNYYQPEDGFDADEVRLPPKELYKLLKRKIAWAEREHTELEQRKKELEESRRQAWIKKELLLEDLLVRELPKEEAVEVLALPTPMKI